MFNGQPSQWEWLQTTEQHFQARLISSDCWEQIIMATWDNEQWHVKFCTSWDILMEICTKLALHMQGNNHTPSYAQRTALPFQSPICSTPFQHRLVNGWKDGSRGKSTDDGPAHQTPCQCTGDYGWVGNLRLPNCIGDVDVDSTHILLLPLEHHVQEFNKQKGYFLIMLQAVVDSSHWERCKTPGYLGAPFHPELLAQTLCPWTSSHPGWGKDCTPTINRGHCLPTAPLADGAVHWILGCPERKVHLQDQQLQDKCRMQHASHHLKACWN